MSRAAIRKPTPTAFDPAQIVPETRAFNDKLGQILAGLLTILEVPARVLHEPAKKERRPESSLARVCGSKQT